MRRKWENIVKGGFLVLMCLLLYTFVRPSSVAVVSPFQDKESRDEKLLKQHLETQPDHIETISMVIGKDSRMCLQTNICKENPSDQLYYYTRTKYFDKMLNSPINMTRNITHNIKVVPNIVHFTWYGGKKKNIFRFHHFITVLSAHRFIKPSVIYFWCDMIPEGDYFTEVTNKVPELKLVRRLPPNEIYGQKVKVAEHITDIIRLEALLEYGGIYFDLDAVVVKALDKLLYYETVMGWESPTGLCNGIILSVPWANFIKIWHREYYSFQDIQWSYHSVRLPAELTIKHRNLIHTENSSMNRPNWSPKELMMLYQEGEIYDFKRKNYFVHLWFRLYGVEHNPRDIRTWDTTVGALFRHVYYGNDTIWSSNQDRDF